MTVRLDLAASRNETWQPTIAYAYAGEPLPLDGASIALQWRLHEGQAGMPLISISLAFEDAAATEEDIAQGLARAGDRLLRLFPAVPVSTLRNLPTGINQPEPGEADQFSWDAVVQYSDGISERLLGGAIMLGKGVTYVP
jgi:hypothetical protein